MKPTKNKAFTLVELIVVITILAVLATVAFISFQGYTSSSRDAVRLSDLKNVEKQLNIHFTQKNKYPDPGNAVAIPSGGSQGVLDKSVTNQIGVSEVQDPLTKDSYFYRISENKRKYQLLGFLENSDSITFFPFSNTFANNDIPFSKGDKLGIVLNADGKTLPTSIDLSTGTYDVIFSSDTQENLSDVSGEDNFVVLKSSDKGFYDESLVGYWDMETFTSDGRLADLSGNNNHGTINDANNSGLATPVNGAMVFDGVDDYVEIADSDELDGMNNFSFVIKFHAENNSTHKILLSKFRHVSPDNTNKSFTVRQLNNGELYGQYLTEEGTYDSHRYNLGDYKGTAIITHSNSQHTLFFNAYENSSSVDITQGISSTNESLYIGVGIKDTGTVDEYPFTGTIDEIFIYNRSLSSAEIKNIFTNFQ